jgi:hypothetical protein
MTRDRPEREEGGWLYQHATNYWHLNLCNGKREQKTQSYISFESPQNFLLSFGFPWHG